MTSSRHHSYFPFPNTTHGHTTRLFVDYANTVRNLLLFLILKHTLGLPATFLCVIFGIFALYANSTLAHISVSQMILTTGIRHLHQAVHGRDDGAKTLWTKASCTEFF